MQECRTTFIRHRHARNTMSSTTMKLIRLATALGAGVWLGRLFLSSTARNSANAAMQAVDEAIAHPFPTRRFGTLAGRANMSADFDVPLDLVQQERCGLTQKEATADPSEKLSEQVLWRVSPSTLAAFNFVFENTNVKSKQKLLDAILLPELERLRGTVLRYDNPTGPAWPGDDGPPAQPASTGDDKT
jgi:hypothetical protein